MLLDLIIAEAVPADPNDSPAATGAITAPSVRTAVIPAIQPDVSTGPSIPYGAAAWEQAHDPSDHLPYAVDFAALLGSSEKIAEIEAVSISSTAAAVGFSVDAVDPYRPIIDVSAGKKIQLWVSVSEGFQNSMTFTGEGIKTAVAIRVRTDTTPPQIFERSAILTVRQL